MESGSVNHANQDSLERLTRFKMVVHKCFDCGKVIKAEYLKKKVRCPYCGSKILFKPRVISSTVKAD